ncbi:MAG TPA: hypothetical protein VJV78_08025 [Polyangiales bacterium]|nr:hypothetical protein [Polyangiales bacterium]
MSKDDPSIPRIRPPRKLAGARRLLVATIGAATVNYAGCGDDTMTLVANLMAAPFMPPPAGGGAGTSAPPVVPNSSQLPAIDQDGGVAGGDDSANSGDPSPRP